MTPKYFVVSTPEAWGQALKTYDLTGAKTPDTFPTMLIIGRETDEDDEEITLDLTHAEVPLKQAAYLLANSTAKQLNQVIPSDTLTKLKLMLGINENKLKNPVLLVQPGILSQKPNMQPNDTLTVTLPDGSTQTLKVGQKTSVNGTEYIIESVSSTKLPTIDPTTGMEGLVEILDEVTTKPIPGLSEIPLDPSKMDSKQKIADLGDPAEHVLDDERAV